LFVDEPLSLLDVSRIAAALLRVVVALMTGEGAFLMFRGDAAPGGYASSRPATVRRVRQEKRREQRE